MTKIILYYLTISLFPFLLSVQSFTVYGLSIKDNGSIIRMSEQNYQLSVDKPSGVVSIQNSSESLEFSLSIQYKKTVAVQGKVIDSFYGKNWIEIRGWMSENIDMWYVLRFEFEARKKALKIYAALSDRHDDHHSSAQWEPYWRNRVFSNFQAGFISNKPWIPTARQQINAISGGDMESATVEMTTGKGFPRWQINRVDNGQLRIKNYCDEFGSNKLIIKPKLKGAYELLLHQQPLLSPYPAAGGIKVSIALPSKRMHLDVLVDQGRARNSLGQHQLYPDSQIVLHCLATERGDTMVFQNLVMRPVKSKKDRTINIYRQRDLIYMDEQKKIAVHDFWQRYPVRAFTHENGFYIQQVLTPTAFAGGMGVAIEMALALSNAKTDPEKILREPPIKATYPNWWHPIDGTKHYHEGFTKLLKKTFHVVNHSDITYINSGWKDWGDYQIGPGYFNDKKVAIEQWGALQYDLTTGLLNAWLKSNDPRLWHRARAAVRNILTTQVAKFSPYTQKRSGAGIRKGECGADFSHWCQEPIPEFNYHARALLLYAHLTDERWPHDVAQMLIDNSAYFAHTRTAWLRKSDRALAWALKNLYYGVKNFPKGTRYNWQKENGFRQMKKWTPYTTLLRNLVEHVIGDIETTGKVRGGQPVWQGQVIDGLAMAYDSGVLTPAMKVRTKKAIVAAVDHFVRQELRWKKGQYDVVYERKTLGDDWRNAENYAWFWLSAISYAGHLSGDSQYDQIADKLFAWVVKRYESNQNLATPRSWSGAIGFPEYFHYREKSRRKKP